jgi:NAD(P)-dependent dehydrogenase (short-subunit alcohol dehydrogenase family)
MKEREEVAVVTGAARGIGRRVALVLAEEGLRIVANDLAAPEETLEELRSAGVKTLSVPGDVSDEAEVHEMAGVVMGEFGRIDVLVNNAGISAIVPAEEMTLAEW